MVIATDDIGLGRLRIRQPAFDVGIYRVDDVVELLVLLDECGHQWAHRDDAQPGVAGGLQRLIDENRCQTAALELVGHLGVREDALPVAIGVLGEADLLSVNGNAEAVGFLGHGRRCAGLVGGHDLFYTPGLGRGRNVAFGSGGAGSRATPPPQPGTAPRGSSCSSHICRYSAMSSWLRPTKFHHITSCSGNGGPPSSTPLAALWPRFTTSRRSRPGAWKARSAIASAVPATSTLPWSSSTPCSKTGSISRVTVAPGSTSSCAPSSAVNVCTGERSPASSSRKTRKVAPAMDRDGGT